MCLNWDLPGVFFTVGLGLWIFRKIFEVKCHSHHIIPRIDAVNRTTYYCYIDLDHMADTASVRFSLCFLFFTLWKEYAPSPESRIST